MKYNPLWQLSVVTSTEAEEAVGDVLAELFGAPASSCYDALKRTTTVSVFLKVRPPESSAMRVALRARLRVLTAGGITNVSPRIRMRELPAENWAESWKRHFKPIDIGGALLIKPSWSRRRPSRGQAVVVLDPGLSFGTGQHATTGFCLRELVARRKAGAKQSFLDVGTGSGILAIAAAKLGYAPVSAFDFDPEAVRVARTNAQRNRVLRRLRLARGDLTRLPARPTRQYDVVCANLLSTLLIAERKRVAGLVAPRGALILAGILNAEFGQVESAYVALGLRLVASRREREWRSGTFAAAPRD